MTPKERRIYAKEWQDFARTQLILGEVSSERLRQTKKWTAHHDSEHSRKDWATLLNYYVQAAFEADNRGAFRKDMVVIAALAVAAIEAQDCKRKAESPRLKKTAKR